MLRIISVERTFPPVPANKKPEREFKVGDKILVNLHHGKIEDAIIRAVIQDADAIKTTGGRRRS